MPRKIVAGNWKMNLGLKEARELFANIVDRASAIPDEVQVLVIPPFPFIHPLNRELPPETPIALGAQDCHQEREGAFTGEVSAPMLASVGAKYGIVGHSERRQQFAEDGPTVRDKAKRLLDEGITPIVCVGEDLEEREAGRAQERITQQVRESILNLPVEGGDELIVAYEPVWAIGTGHTASSEQAQEMHAHIRRELQEAWGEERGSKTSLLYGGSCKAKNAEALFEQKDIDGGLIGGASLKAEEFRSIIRSFP
jgi:triosephosphate isomerase